MLSFVVGVYSWHHDDKHDRSHLLASSRSHVLVSECALQCTKKCMNKKSKQGLWTCASNFVANRCQKLKKGKGARAAARTQCVASVQCVGGRRCPNQSCVIVAGKCCPGERLCPDKKSCAGPGECCPNEFLCPDKRCHVFDYYENHCCPGEKRCLSILDYCVPADDCCDYEKKCSNGICFDYNDCCPGEKTCDGTWTCVPVEEECPRVHSSASPADIPSLDPRRKQRCRLRPPISPPPRLCP
jgi:hypothetical protein